MTLLLASELQALVQTSLSTNDLYAIIAREEALLIDVAGPHPVDSQGSAVTLTESHDGGQPDLWLNRPISSVTQVDEYTQLAGTAATLVEDTDFFVVAGQGRLIRLPESRRWGRFVTVQYVPEDDSDQRKAALIELVRLALERTTMKSESVAGEYSYTARDENQDEARARIYRAYQLTYPGV